MLENDFHRIHTTDNCMYNCFIWFIPACKLLKIMEYPEGVFALNF